MRKRFLIVLVILLMLAVDLLLFGEFVWMGKDIPELEYPIRSVNGINISRCIGLAIPSAIAIGIGLVIRLVFFARRRLSGKVLIVTYSGPAIAYSVTVLVAYNSLKCCIRMLVLSVFVVGLAVFIASNIVSFYNKKR